MTAATMNGAKSGTSSVERARAEFAREIGKRVPRPVDVLELAAVVESMGVTDTVARDDFGAADVFELADAVFPQVLVASSRSRLLSHTTNDPQIEVLESERVATLETTGRGLLALAPLAFLILAMQVLGAAGWTTSSILALSFGITAAMLCTSGPILAIGRRTAIYLGFEYGAPARRFLAQASAATLLACIGASAALFSLGAVLGYFDVTERAIAAIALVGGSALWLLVASLTLVGFAAAAMACLGIGLGTGIAVGMLAGSPAGLAAGYAASIIALFAASSHAYRADQSRQLRLPAPTLLVLEAIPYAAYGSAFALLLFEPHALGWVGHTSGTRGQALITLELSLTLALPPVLLASGVHEHIMRSFWRYARLAQERNDAPGFRRLLTHFHATRRSDFAKALGAMSCLAVIVVEVVTLLGGLKSASQLVFLSGIVGFFLLGLGQFSCLFMLSLGRPKQAIYPVLVGTAVVTAVAAPLTFVDFRLVAPAFMAGAAVFAVRAMTGCRRVLEHADYHYATTF